ncbi:unnamed protein product [Tuwongella immobilis]|uniref:Uncharacterized protein n=1 Tax=Tuwongella immobilis TaxID=692036 RepID=A0A6C2YHR0_9BACT|nr:unnamed protein product [Tuwongella immobilis]VTR97561.1 unnamed protein product [Tuwongella immobilis]
MTNLDDKLISELRALATAGASVPELLRFLWNRLGSEAAYGTTLAKYFMRAFHLPLRAVAPVGGWSPDSEGGVADEVITQAIHPLMLETKSQWAAK